MRYITFPDGRDKVEREKPALKTTHQPPPSFFWTFPPFPTPPWPTETLFLPNSSPAPFFLCYSYIFSRRMMLPSGRMCLAGIYFTSLCQGLVVNALLNCALANMTQQRLKYPGFVQQKLGFWYLYCSLTNSLYRVCLVCSKTKASKLLVVLQGPICETLSQLGTVIDCRVDI